MLSSDSARTFFETAVKSIQPNLKAVYLDFANVNISIAALAGLKSVISRVNKLSCLIVINPFFSLPEGKLFSQEIEHLTPFSKLWLDHHLTKTSEQAKIGKAIRYCLSNWIELNSYLKDGRVEIDNNLIENAIRPFALGRKNWLFMGSPSGAKAGAKAGAIFYSLIETCKANDIEPYKYFCDMLHRIRECVTESDCQQLLPQSMHC